MSKISLKDILRDKRKEVERRKAKEPIELLKKKISSLPPVRDFKKAIFGTASHQCIGKRGNLMTIAEIKKKSPSAGFISGVEPIKIAREYEASRHCCAISVLTDKKYFGGNINLLKIVKSVTRKPILRKDFIIDEYQLYESRAYGADMILLIAGILSQKKLRHFLKIAKNLGLSCLIESHSLKDLKKIPEGAEIYGINNRDMARDFSVNPYTAKKLIRYIPPKKIIVVESGIKTKEDINFIMSLKRVNAVLIGTSILKSPHPGKALERLFKF